MDSNNEAAKSATNDNQIVLSQIAIDYLLKATNWAKFLSILGFIAAAFLASTAMFMGATVANMSSIGVDNSLLMLIGSSIPIIYFIGLRWLEKQFQPRRYPLCRSRCRTIKRRSLQMGRLGHRR